LAKVPDQLSELIPPFEADAWLGIIASRILAFFEFFELKGIVNLVEETWEPE
jgi:hypothetical protein